MKYKGLEILLNQEKATREDLEKRLARFEADRRASISRTEEVINWAVERQASHSPECNTSPSSHPTTHSKSSSPLPLKMLPPSGPPPQNARRRSTHDGKWLHSKLQKMGLRSDPTVARVEPERPSNRDTSPESNTHARLSSQLAHHQIASRPQSCEVSLTARVCVISLLSSRLQRMPRRAARHPPRRAASLPKPS